MPATQEPERLTLIFDDTVVRFRVEVMQPACGWNVIETTPNRGTAEALAREARGDGWTRVRVVKSTVRTREDVLT